MQLKDIKVGGKFMEVGGHASFRRIETWAGWQDGVGRVMVLDERWWKVWLMNETLDVVEVV